MTVTPFVLSLALLGTQPDPPDAAAIERSLNESVELPRPDFQVVSGLKILAGGKTQERECLFVCEGRLVWAVSVDELKDKVEDAAKRLGAEGKIAAALAPWAIDQKASQFKKGDVVTRIRVRVRLERAGEDWIVMSAKIKELDGNPLPLHRSSEKKATAE